MEIFTSTEIIVLSLRNVHYSSSMHFFSASVKKTGKILSDFCSLWTTVQTHLALVSTESMKGGETFISDRN